MKLFLILAVILFAFFNTVNSQEPGFGAGFLMNNNSPVITASGGAGVAFSVDDATSVIYNPAHLGINTRNNNILLTYNYNESHQPAPYNQDFPYNNFAINLGYGLDSIINFPINLGVSYIRRTYGEVPYTKTSENGQVLSRYNVNQLSNEFSLAASYKYYALFSFGITYKMINTELKRVFGNNTIINADVGAFDFGILAKIPVVQNYILSNNYNADVDFTAGVALLNLGNELITDGEAPLPRNSSIGYSVSAGIKYVIDDFQINCFNADFSVAAISNMVEYHSSGFRYTGFSYAGVMNDFNAFDNLILLKNSGRTRTNYGVRFSLFEFITYSKGINNLGFDNLTNGYEISSKGLSKILYYLFEDNFFKNIYNNVDLTYSTAKLQFDQSNDFEQYFVGFNLSVKL